MTAAPKLIRLAERASVLSARLSHIVGDLALEYAKEANAIETELRSLAAEPVGVAPTRPIGSIEFNAGYSAGYRGDGCPGLCSDDWRTGWHMGANDRPKQPDSAEGDSHGND